MNRAAIAQRRRVRSQSEARGILERRFAPRAQSGGVTVEGARSRGWRAVLPISPGNGSSSGTEVYGDTLTDLVERAEEVLNGLHGNTEND